MGRYLTTRALEGLREYAYKPSGYTVLDAWHAPILNRERGLAGGPTLQVGTCHQQQFSNGTSSGLAAPHLCCCTLLLFILHAWNDARSTLKRCQ